MQIICNSFPSYIFSAWYELNDFETQENRHYLGINLSRGGGTPSVKLVGRLRGFDPPFSRHWEKI